MIDQNHTYLMGKYKLAGRQKANFYRCCFLRWLQELVNSSLKELATGSAYRVLDTRLFFV